MRRWFALGFTIYSALNHMLLYYCHDWRHMKSIYFSICAAHVFWFAYAKVSPSPPRGSGQPLPAHVCWGGRPSPRCCSRAAHVL